MILTCPSCSASYNVPSEAIGVKGRDVRCKKCGHTWFQAGEKKALDDLISRIQDGDIQVDDISFAENSKVKKKKVEDIERKSIFISLKNLLFSNGSTSSLKYFSGVMVALAVFFLCLWGIVAFRTGIIKLIPQMVNVYEISGVPIVSYSYSNPETSFIIERLQLGERDKKPVLSGTLINLTSSNVWIPPLQITFLDSYGNLIQSNKYNLPAVSLNKELSLDWVYEVSSEVAEKTKTVHVGFSPQQ